MSNYLSTLHTITGYTFPEALAKLKEVLPPEAYKEVGGGSGKKFTDISPAYQTEVVTEVFGPAGIGWFWNYDSNDVSLFTVEKKNSNRSWTDYVAHIKRFSFVYVYVDAEGNTRYSAEIISTGGSDNSDAEYALKGAITNALGGALAKLCWQIDVYKGKLDHNNAAEAYRKQQARKNGTTTPVSPVTTDNGKAQVKETPAPVAVAESSAETNVLASAKSTVILDDILELPSTVRGKSLGEVMGDPIFGEKKGNLVIGYLAKVNATAKQQWFDDSTLERQALSDAAKVLWADYTARQPAKKSK